jgi:hypothetical protein
MKNEGEVPMSSEQIGVKAWVTRIQQTVLVVSPAETLLKWVQVLIELAALKASQTLVGISNENHR